ncbi:MAG: PAS domain S-box protein [Magnetospiraceae bacterium]
MSAAVAVLAGAYIYAEVTQSIKAIATRDAVIVDVGARAMSRQLTDLVTDLLILSEHQIFLSMYGPLSDPEKAVLARDFKTFVAEKRYFDQVRFLDAKGMEVVRVNRTEDAAAITPDGELQNKAKRYYFEDAFKLELGEIFVSPLDLNIEHGKIEEPFKPMIRIGTPIYDQFGVKRGVLLFNYLAQQMLHQFSFLTSPLVGQGMILNADGYWLHGPAPEKEWAFMRGREDSFATEFSVAWQTILATDSGQFTSESGLFTFATVYPLQSGERSSTGSSEAFGASMTEIAPREYFWKVVSHVPNGHRIVLGKRILRHVLIFLAPVYAAMTVGIWFLASTYARRKAAEADLLENQRTIALLQHIAVTANEANEPSQALQMCLDEICAYTDWPVGHCFFAENEQGELYSSAVWHFADEPRYQAFRQATETTPFVPGVGLPGEVYANKKADWIADIGAEQEFLRYEAARDAGIVSAFAFPVLIRDDVVAVLEFFSDAPVHEVPLPLPILGQIGTQIGRVFERRRAMKELRIQVAERTQDLGKRVKEIGCLYTVSEILKGSEASLGETFLAIAEALPQGFSHPAAACARVTAEKHSIYTANFRETPWRLTSPILIDGKPGGAVEVAYLEQLPARDHGPFLEQERLLLDKVAADIGENLARNAVSKALRESRDNINLLLSSTAEAIFGLDAQGRCYFCNPACLTALGYHAEDQLIGQHMHALIHHSHADGSPLPEADCQFQLTASSGEGVYSDQEVFWRQDGTAFPVEYWSYPIKREGVLRGVVVTFMDITQRKEAERALLESRESFRRIVEDGPVPMAITDGQGTVTLLNGRFTALFGWRVADAQAVGDWWGQIFPDQEMQAVFARNGKKTRRAATLAEIAPQQWRLKCKNGDTRNVVFQMVTISEDTSVVAMQDITDLKRTEAALVHAMHEAEQANAHKSRFLANVSHDLRTPLNAIIGFSELMQTKLFGPLGNDHYDEYVVDIHQSGLFLLNLINDLLDLSKAEAGKFDLHEKVFDLGKQVEATARLIQPQAQSLGIDLSIEIDPDLPHLRGDEKIVVRMVNNLLSNAVKFTDSGGQVTVRVGAAPTGGLDLIVADTGIGMTREEITKALKPFVQTDSSHARPHDGTGLGLSLTEKFVKMHKGSLIIDSEKGRGTQITARFPATRAVKVQNAII